MSNLLSAKALTHSFAGRVLFKDIQFGIDAGQRVGLIGPNGAGKSTLVKILAQQIKADSGQLTWRKGLRVAYLEQSPQFGEHDEIQSTIANHAIDEHQAIADSYEWIRKMDLHQWPDDHKISSLSGGWKKRVALACQLIKKPDLLILDEPTNHLDVDTILWLEEFLQSLSRNVATIIVTHDRVFLDRVANFIWDLDPKLPQNILVTEGSYSKHIENKEAFLESEVRKQMHLQNTLRRETEWLRRGAIARQTKQKARIENADKLANEVEDLKYRNSKQSIGIQFKNTERAPKILVEFDSISKSFADKKLFENFSGLITAKTRLGLIGANGAGKSTLLKVLLGEIASDTGFVKKYEDIKICYFQQHADDIDPKMTLLGSICPEGDYVFFQGKYIIARTYLEGFGFRRDQMDVKVDKLSGGEQARLRIAQLMLQPAQILVLDEPTNDLDLPTLEVLEDALNKFDGAILLVTHDRFFMGQIASEILCFPEMIRFADYFQWETWNEDKFALQKSQKNSAKNSESKNTSAANSKPKKLSFKEQHEFDGIEEKIQNMEQELSELQSRSVLPEVVSNASEIQQIYGKMGALQQSIEKAYDRWAELSARKGQ